MSKYVNNINNWYTLYTQTKDDKYVFKIADAYVGWIIKYTRNGTQKLDNDEALSYCYYATARALNKYDKDKEASFATILHYEMLGIRKGVLISRKKNDMYRDIIDSADEYPGDPFMTYDINNEEYSVDDYSRKESLDLENGIVNSSSLLRIADDIGLNEADISILENFLYNNKRSEDLYEILEYIKLKLGE